MNLKNSLHTFSCLALMAGFLAACGGNTPAPSSSSSSIVVVSSVSSSSVAVSSSSVRSSSVASSVSSVSSASSSLATVKSICPDNAPCKILPLGDSITEGMVKNASGSYIMDGAWRVQLFRRAVKDGMNVTFVGTNAANGPTTVENTPFPRANEGHSGWTIKQIDDKLPKPYLDVAPHIIILHIGTNDMNGTAATGSETRLGALVDKIIKGAPDSLLVVSSIIPFPQASANVTKYNGFVPNIVQDRKSKGAKIVYVDQFAGFPTAELGDGVHPNPTGYNRMGDKFYDGIYEYLKKK